MPVDAEIGPAGRADAPMTRFEVVARADARDRQGIVLAAYEEHQGALMSFAYAVTRDTNVAEDLVQETFLRLVAEVSDRQRPDNVRAWLYRVCGNLAVSRARRRAVADRFAPLLAFRSDAAAADAHVIRDEETRALVDALAHVSPDARAALVMAAQGFSGREIAQALRRSESSTRTMMFRAREKVRTELSRGGYER